MGSAQPADESSADFHTIDEADARQLLSALEGGDLGALEGKLKVLSNRTRLKILTFLRDRDLCVHDLSALLEMSQSAVSHQLKELRNQKLVTRRREGRVAYYSLADEALESILDHLRGFIEA